MNKDNEIKLKEALDIILSLREEIYNSNFDNENLIQTSIEAGVLLLHSGKVNLLYNMKYREKQGDIIRNQYFARKRKNNPNGTDLNSIPSCECKSVTNKTKRKLISNNLRIGEVDKVYNKRNNLDSKYSTDTQNHVIFSLYKDAYGSPFIAFYVDNKDFGETIQPLINEAAKILDEKTVNLTIKGRDSLSLNLNNFINCSSLDIAFLSDDDIFIEQSFIDSLNKKSNFYKTIIKYIENGKINII